MSLDRANRSYITLLLSAAALFAALAAASCALLTLLVYRLAADGSAVVDGRWWAAIPGVAFLAVNIGGAAIGVNALASQLVSTRRLAGRVGVRTIARSPEVLSASERTGLAKRVVVVDDDQQYSFTFGALHRRVAVSRGLAEAMSPDELDAVLVHERYHVRNFDPLKVVVARSLSRGFFLVPAIGRLESRYVAMRELAADHVALEAKGRRALAGALMKVVKGPAWPELRTAAAIGGPELLGIRIDQLESGAHPDLDRLPGRAIAVSVLALLLLVAGFAAAVFALGGVRDALGPGAAATNGAPAAAMAALCALPSAAAAWVFLRWARG